MKKGGSRTWPSKYTAVEHVRKHSSYVFCIDVDGLGRIMNQSRHVPLSLDWRHRVSNDT